MQRSRKRMSRKARLRSTKPMNRVGPVTRRRRKISRQLTAEAKRNGHDFCEIAPVLSELGIDSSPCFGDLTNAHSVKSSPRGSNPVLDRETCRGCEHHHFGVLDLKTHAIQLQVVREAIARRSNETTA